MFSFSILWAFIGPVSGLFIPVNEAAGIYQTLSRNMIVDAQGIALPHNVRIHLIAARPEGIHPEGSVQWIGHNQVQSLPSYRSIQWKNPGMRAQITTMNDKDMELQFFLDAGVSPDEVVIKANNGTFVRVDQSIVLVHQSDTLLRFSSFHAFQGLEERKMILDVSPQRIQFSIPDWTPDLPLVIDPITAVITGPDTVQIFDVKSAPDSTSIYAVGSVKDFWPGNGFADSTYYGSINTPGMFSHLLGRLYYPCECRHGNPLSDDHFYQFHERSGSGYGRHRFLCCNRRMDRLLQ